MDIDGKEKLIRLTYGDFVLVLMIVAVLGLGIRVAIVSRLRARHSQIWRELGAPPPISYGFGGRASHQLTTYVWKARWLGSNDALLIVLGVLNFVLAAALAVLLYLQFAYGF